MRIALIQQTAGHDKADNVRRGIAALERAAHDGAELVAFAELAFERFHPQVPAGPDFASLAEPVPGPITDTFAAKARELGVVVVLNLYERDGEQCYDTSPVIDADGSLLGSTRMVHITEYDCFHEQGYYTPGDTGAPVFDTKVGRVGIAICYDRHFPEYMRALGPVRRRPRGGAAGRCRRRVAEGLYEAEMQVAAFQNGYFVGAVQPRRPGGEASTFAGESFVCAPDGRVIARGALGDDDIVMANLDLGQVGESHARQLFLRHRRPDLYADWIRAR